MGEHVEPMTDDRLAKIVKEKKIAHVAHGAKGGLKKDVVARTNIFILFFSYCKKRGKPIEKIKKKKKN